MFTAEIANRTDMMKAAAVLAAAAAFAIVVSVQFVGIAIQRVQLQDQGETMPATTLLLAQDHSAGVTAVMRMPTSAEELAKATAAELSAMMDAAVQYLVSLDVPTRRSPEIEAALRTAAISDGFNERIGLALANELNAALFYEDLKGRIVAIAREKSRRANPGEIGRNRGA